MGRAEGSEAEAFVVAGATSEARASARARNLGVLRALAIVFAVIAAGCMILAIAGMATGRQSARTGWLVRVVALLCFGAAVGLNVAAH